MNLKSWLVLAFLLLAPASLRAEPVKIIFDTDMDTDCDDIGALAMLHALADKGEAEILATMVSSKYPWSVPCTDAINTYFGRPDVPIGAPRGQGAPINRGSRYAKQLAGEFKHDLTTEKADDAVKLYRKILAAQPDHSVVIVTVGYLTNLSDLLKSAPDKYSKLTGKELVAQKVKLYVCMGSRYPADRDPGKWGNFKPHPEAVVHVVKDWPTKIIFTGGGPFAQSLATGARLARKQNIVRRGYEHYFGGTARQRHSADQIAVLVAVRGAGKPWKLTSKGYNHIFPNGTHEWRTDKDDPRQHYVSALADGVKADDVARLIDELMLYEPKNQRGD